MIFTYPTQELVTLTHTHPSPKKQGFVVPAILRKPPSVSLLKVFKQALQLADALKFMHDDAMPGK